MLRHLMDALRRNSLVINTASMITPTICSGLFLIWPTPFLGPASVAVVYSLCHGVPSAQLRRPGKSTDRHNEQNLATFAQLTERAYHFDPFFKCSDWNPGARKSAPSFRIVRSCHHAPLKSRSLTNQSILEKSSGALLLICHAIKS